MSAIAMLKAQHREAERLLDLLLRGGDRPAEQEGRLAELARMLHTHHALEEGWVYPAARSVELEVMSSKAQTEHGLAETILAELVAGGLEGVAYEARLRVLKELLLHHVDIEEKEFFPKLEARLGVTRLELLGAALAEQLRPAEEGAAGHA